MSELFKTAIVEKRNVLNELRSNNMTVQELRFFSIYLSKINPYDLSTRNVCFPIEDFQRIMGFGKLNIKQLCESTDSLLCKIVHVPDENGRGMRAFQLFKECHLFQDNNNKWYVEIDAHDKALPLMFEFKNRYFTYELWNALRLKSPNQVRMYEILKQYEGLGKRELTVTELRELLGIGKNEYSGRTGWSDFKKKVLDSCQEALKESTDICYTYERGKVGKGGKWLSVVFHIRKNTGYKDPLSLDEFIRKQPAPEPIETTPAVPSETQQSEDDNPPKYSSSYLEFIAEAVHREFDEAELLVLNDLANTKDLSKYDTLNNAQITNYNYLSAMYNKLNVYSKKQKIDDRFAYLKKMIEDD